MPTISAAYNPANNTLTLIPNGNFPVKRLASATFEINLSTNPPSGGEALFTATPITWGSGGSPPGVAVNGANTAKLTITETNNNNAKTAVEYPFTVNVTYSASASADPTIVNEGTGQE